MSEKPVDRDSDVPSWVYYILYVVFGAGLSLALFFIYLIITT